MGFLEKLKNTFFEEEYVEVEEKVRPKKEVVREVRKASSDIKPLIEEEKVRNIRRDEIVHEGLPDRMKEEIKERPVEKVKVETKVSQKEKFSYFDDDDFIEFKEEKTSKYARGKEEFYEEKVVSEKPKVYNNPEYAKKNKVVSTQPVKQNVVQPTAYSKQTTTFKPTPIISPIYGILDQNYTKDEIADKRESRPSSYVSRKNADLDSIREKAFGTLTNDLGLTGQANDEIIDIEDTEIKIDEVEDNLLYDMTDISITPTVDKVTLQDAEEYFQDLGLEYNIDYKDAKLERATGRRVAKTPKAPEIEEDEVNNPIKKKKNEDYSFSMEDNLFDLIDSMYEEKE